MSKLITKCALVCVVVLLVGGLTRASLKKFEQHRQAIMTASQAEQKRLGLTDRTALYAKHPSPEITLAPCLLLPPGGTGELVVKGKFQPGTQFVITSDNIEVIKEAATATEYRATIKAAPGIGPDSASVEAYTPVSGANDRSASVIFVGGKFEWEVKADNGWRVKARNETDTRCGSGKSGDPTVTYLLEFFKGVETTPFAKRQATLYYDQYNSKYNFSISDQDEEAMDFQAEVKKMYTKLADPNLSDTERDTLMAKMQALTQKMIAGANDMAAMQKKAAEQEAKKKEFGCRDLSLTVGTGGALTGQIRCGQNVGQPKVTGAMKFLAK